MATVVVVTVGVAAADASLTVTGLVTVVSAVPLAAIAVAVPKTVGVVFGHGCGRSNFRSGS